jgi:replicative DNA helicase
VSDEKRMPQNVSAEVAVVGSAMVFREVLDAMTLKPSDFYDPRHAAVFAAIQALYSANKPTDLSAVSTELERAGKLAGVGGLAFLAELTAEASPEVSVAVRQVADTALQRRVIQRASEVMTKGLAGGLSGDELLEELERATTGLESSTPDPTAELGVHAAREFVTYAKALSARQAGEPVSLKLRTGIGAFDRLMRGGLPLCNVTILGGRPSQGKSALARSIASSVNLVSCGEDGVHYLSTEDSIRALVLRQLADEADLDLGKLWDLDVSQIDFQRLMACAQDLSKRRGWLVETTRGISAQEIARRVRRHKRANRTKLVVVDYAQIISAPGKTEYDRLTAVSQTLSRMAENEGVSVLLLSQINRDSEKNDANRPTMANLKGSGSLEQDAECVLLVHRPEYYLAKRDADTGSAQERLDRWRGLGLVILEKAKNSPCGEITLSWDAKSATYRDRASWRARGVA